MLQKHHFNRQVSMISLESQHCRNRTFKCSTDNLPTCPPMFFLAKLSIDSQTWSAWGQESSLEIWRLVWFVIFWIPPAPMATAQGSSFLQRENIAPKKTHKFCKWFSGEHAQNAKQKMWFCCLYFSGRPYPQRQRCQEVPLPRHLRKDLLEPGNK